METYFETFVERMADYFLDEELEQLTEIVDNLEFKYRKTIYHLENIKDSLSKSKDFHMENYYDRIYNSIYYETESFVISLRSSIDILMHLINFTMRLGIENNDVNLGNVYKHPGLPNSMKNVFRQYTHNRNSVLWNFLSRFRNEIVHEKSIINVLPIFIDVFQRNQAFAYIEINNRKEDLITYLEISLKFLEKFIMQIIEQIMVVAEYKS